MDTRRRFLGNKRAIESSGTYTVNLNGQWEKTTAVPNPDSTLYDGVYRSASNYNVNSGVAIMYITVSGYSTFKLYIRSYAETTWDYVMVSQLDKTITGSTSYANTTLVKAHTSGNQQSGTALSNYTLVEFTGIPAGVHTITVVYRKDTSVNQGDDRGYLLIPIQGEGGSEGGGDVDIDTTYSVMYTSSNGAVVTPSNSTVFGSNITSNTYINGQGIITFDGPVTTIGARAFDGRSGLTSLTIPDSVTSIGEMAFYGCSSLTSVTIPDSVTTIEYGAFYSCTNLTTVRLPSRLTELCERIFYSCTNLHTITIPDSVTTIRQWAFSSCTNINLVIPKSVVVMDHPVTNCGGSLTVRCNITVTPSSYEQGAFAKNNFHTITVGDPNDTSPISIAKRAFESNEQLQHLTLHNNVVSIGEEAFSDCSSLATITIPESVTEIGKNAFNNSKVLNDVTIKGNKVNVGEWAFSTQGSKSYTLNLQGSLGRVDAYAFRYCSSVNVSNISDWCSIVFTSSNSNPFESAKLYVDGVLVSDLIIPNNVSTINDLVFETCRQLKSVIIPDSVTEIKSKAFYNCTGLTSVEIGNSVTKIGDGAFASCSALKYLTLPDSVTEIGNQVFQGCQKWENIRIPSNITYIGNSAFSSCYNLTTVTLPNTLVTLGEGVFSSCYNITAFYGKFASADHCYLLYNNTVVAVAHKATSTFTIPNSVTSIGSYAFNLCRNLVSVTIPNSVTEIGEGAFSHCSKLTSISIPDNVTQIPPNTCLGCDNLTTITIGMGVTYIGSSGCDGSKNPTTVYCKAIVPPSTYRPSNSVYDPFDFTGISTGVIYVPRESLDAYKTHTQWSFYADYIQPYDF